MPFDGATPGSGVGSSRSCLTKSSARPWVDEKKCDGSAKTDAARNVFTNKSVRVMDHAP
jgi:hypothetical protein